MEVDQAPSAAGGASAPAAAAAAAGGGAVGADFALFSAAVTAAIHGWDPLVVRSWKYIDSCTPTVW